MRRRHLLETLEARQLLAGPQLIGVQPNDGELIDDGTVRDTAPRVLTFRFDEDQRIDANTLGAIQLTRGGADGTLGTADDVVIAPGLVTLGDPNENEVIVRFADSLPNDQYRINIFGYDDANAGIVGLRNLDGELIQPSVAGQRSERIDFRLDLGALIEAIVPQPVYRGDDGELFQNRDEIVVYFNEDPLFTEDDAQGNPTARSAENPRFYQLLLTQDTVRTTDDLYEGLQPKEVIYDANTHTARLIFDTDINNLPGVPVGGGTFRLRIGTAVDRVADLIVDPQTFETAPRATISLGASSQGAGTASFDIVSRQVGEGASGRPVDFVDTGVGGLQVSPTVDGGIVIDFGGSTPLVSDLANAIASSPTIRNLISLSVSAENATLPIPRRLIGSEPIELVGLGDTLGTALNVGVFGQDDNLTSLVIRESISPQQVNIELPGSDDDPGHRLLIEHINDAFGPDTQAGITVIPYNFQGVYQRIGNTSSLNQITPEQKLRIREVLELWSERIGVQFEETADEGITFALGEVGTFISGTVVPQLQASVAVDPAINRTDTAAMANAAIVFSNQANFGLSYGEDFTRKAAAGVGLLLGLLAAPDQSPQVLMALSAFNEEALLRRPRDGFVGVPVVAPTTDPDSPEYQRFEDDFPEFRGFLNDLIDPISLSTDVPTIEGVSVSLPDNIDDFELPNWEPVFPSNVDVLHGQHVHRPDSVDVDLYRFEVALGDADRIGTLTVETFAERLADASGLDTTLTLFEEVNASVITDLRIGPALQLEVEAIESGTSGNGSRIEFVESDRLDGEDDIRILRVDDGNGGLVNNAILVDLPRRGRFITSVEVGDLISAIEGDSFASSLFRINLLKGAPSTDISGQELRTTPIILRDGGLQQISRNDDYFSEDSFLSTSLGEGVYYIGVASTGNDTYDPMISNSGFGGLTQGDYELRIKFEPQVDEVDVIRDRDGTRLGIPGTPIDGDGDGAPRGVNNFWFQTRPELRTLSFNLDGAAITPNQTVTVVGATGVSRTYEFVPLNGGNARPGNVLIRYNNTPGNDSPAGNLAELLATAINGRQSASGVSATVNGANLTLEGERTIQYSNGFRGIETLGKTIFVDKLGTTEADGSLDSPFNNINNPAVVNAFGAAVSGDIVRIVGNGGADTLLSTETDNFAYEFGVSEIGGQILEDGRDMIVPRGVTTMIDAGAIIKLRSARVSVGSSTIQVDRSGSALQVLGTPRLVDFTGATPTLIAGENSSGLGYDDGSVIFTSTRDRRADAVGAGTSPAPRPGDWGGLVFRRDVDQSQGRRDLEDEGIFLQTVNHAEIRYGGSSDILIDTVQQLVNPIQMVNLRPNITFNEITLSADAAMSAAPDSFRETTFGTPAFQQAGVFTPDYSRVGPEIHNNRLTQNSINGLFIRTIVSPTSPPSQLTTSARFDDIDVVHFIAENLVIAGTPGGAITDGIRPSLAQASAQIRTGGSLPTGTQSVRYLMTYVDANGFESAATEIANGLTVTAAAGSTLAGASIRLAALPGIPVGTDYISRRLYRSDFNASGNSIAGYRLIADLDGSNASFVDSGSAAEGTLDLNRVGRRGRLDASLVIDPGMVLKLQGARVELGHSSQLLAEGTEAFPVVITSALDDRFGAGGTFDTNNDNSVVNGQQSPQRGDWSGLYAGPNATVSLDNAVVAFGGGISLIEGGESRGFAPLELHQANGRVTNSLFEFNDDGQDGSGAPGRGGRLAITPSVIFVRGAQPTIVGNDFVDNRGDVIGIDVDSLTADLHRDLGRQTGFVSAFSELDDNFGPLIRGNRFEVVPADDDADKQISGLVIRGGDLLVESIWDDTDIVHVLSESVTVGNIQSSGGLRLQSRPNESLVVKLAGGGTPNSPTIGTGLTASGSTSDSAQRLGGTVHIIGLPGAPVVLTSFKDDTVGAGLGVDGRQFTDTNGDSFGSRPAPNDWRSILLDQYSNDRNVDVQLERELATDVAPGRNGTIGQAQFVGELARDLTQGDENRRLGFEVIGYLSEANDIDTYSFVGSAGSQIWVDVDRTTFSLDTVIELLDSEGRLLARSDNSLDESIIIADPSVEGLVGSLQATADAYAERDAFGQYKDLESANPRDAGFRITLPGNSSGADNRSTFYFRVRSASNNPNDPTSGGSRGNYQFQVRLQEAQEYPGSVVRFADIRYSNHGIHTRGLPGQSPLLGEAGENESVDELASNDFLESVALGNDNRAPQQRPQNVGNLLEGKNPVISVAGSLSDTFDVDFYQVDIDALISTEGLDTNYLSTIFDIDYAAGLTRPDTNLSIFYDPDGEFGPALPELVLFGADSNVAEDQTSPFGEGSDLAERLARGSFSTSDPLIGPVSLPEGSYYVAVTSSGRVPAQLLNTDVRREPINSVERIFEDRIDDFAGEGSVAGGPRFPELFSEVEIIGGGFQTTNLRGNELGHGVYGNFDNSNTPQSVLSQTLYSESGFFGSVFPGAPYTGSQFLPDAAGLPFTATDLNALQFSLANNPQIGGTFDYTASTIPHVSIEGTLSTGTNAAGDIADFYQLVVSEDNTRVIIDIDEGFNPFQGEDDGDLEDLFRFDPNSINVDLVILNTEPAIVTPPGRIDTSFATAGELGSVAPTFVFDDDDIVGQSEDPFFDGFLDAGVYFIGIIESDTTVAISDAGAVTVARTGPAVSGRYLMHVSIDTLEIGGGVGENQSLWLNRNAETRGELRSETFDLTGYVAEDLPRFYFNYLWDSPTDTVRLNISSDTDDFVQTLSSTNGDFEGIGEWRQQIVDLSEFAGKEGIRFEFEYDGDSIPLAGVEGLFLDDFIVGFAERGETVFNAIPGQTDFTGFASGASGEYQLEMRRATNFATPTGTSQILTTAFDTNARHAQEVTLVVPSGSQIQDGDTFELSDGRTTQVFEFDLDGTARFGNQRLPFAATDTAVELAMKVRAAINASTQLQVEAASASGLADQAMTGNRLNLFGITSGSLAPITSFTDAPAFDEALNVDVVVREDGDSERRISLPAVLHNGIGDSNFTRTQGQVLIENNTISDVHAIGIWSDPGDRGTDIEDLRQDPLFGGLFFSFFNPFDNGIFGLDRTGILDSPHPFLELPPVGNPAAGVARNLPTLNNSVEGGLASGVVVRNNTIDQAGLSGVKIQGETRPFVIDHSSLFLLPGADAEDFESFLGSPSLISDGFAMAIDAGGTRVVFEFEDIGGAAVNVGGSGSIGGDGYADGHVPIYFRHALSAGAYNNTPPRIERNYPHNSFELMLSIQQAIQGSILVTNGAAELVTATLAPSPNVRNGFFEQFARTPESFPSAAVYLEGVSNIYFTSAYTKVGGSSTLFVDEANVADAPQPFARVVNNTIYGADGTQSLFADAAADDDNDTLDTATVTYAGRAHTGPYIQNGAIGYNLPQGLSDQTLGFRAVLDGQNLTNRVTSDVSIGIEFPSIADNPTDGRPADAVNANVGITSTGVSIDFLGNGTVAEGNFSGYIIDGDFSELLSIEVSPASTIDVDVSFTDNQLLINLPSGENINGADQVFLNLVFPERVLPSALIGVADVNDLDLYQVELVVGDRLIVDVDTELGGPDTIIQLFDQFGQRQVLNFGEANETLVADNGAAPGHLDPQSTVFTDAASGRVGTVIDEDNGRDPFLDFTTLTTGTYYVAISSAGNVGFDPNSVSGRTGGTGGTGEYRVGIEVYAPRQFVMSLDNGNENQNGGNTGTTSAALIGTTFTISQIPDFSGDYPNFPVSGGVPNTVGNQLTFEFTDSVTGIVLGNGNYNVPLIVGAANGGYRVPEIMDAIAQAIQGLQDQITGADIPALPNYENGNGPGGRSGPIQRAHAVALGGQDGDNAGINNLSDPSRRPGISRTAPPLHYIFQTDSDFPLGFGHEPQETLDATLLPANTLTDGFSTTELYVLFSNVAEIELSPEAMAAGLKLTTNPYRPSSDNNNRVEFAENSDQLIIESGIWVTGGASPTLLNNVLSNLHQSIVVEESSFFGFGKRVDVAGDFFVKPQQVIVNGSVFQHDESRNSEIRFDITWPIDPEAPFDVVDTSLSTDDVIGATNVTVQSGDFNFFVQPGDVLLSDSPGNNFLPADGSRVIDSATSSLNERNAFASVKNSVGLPSSNVLSPDRDVNGVLRADNPNFATPGGLGQSIFKDRGSNELADFVGPIAIAVNPRDNDAAGLDGDIATSFISRGPGVLNEFRIQLVDTGDDSDPFTGIGVDDSTVLVAQVAGLRKPGANVTVFEGDELLTEGVDYTFSYDETSNTIILKPLAGVWRDDQSYRISLNNRDRTVLIAPSPTDVSDGDQVRITDSDGGTVVFEFESGYQLFLPEALTLVVPEVGTGVGGLRDGDIFQISDGVNEAVVFEFDRDNVLLPGSLRIELPAGPAPTDAALLDDYLLGIANSIQAAITSPRVDANGQPLPAPFDFDVKIVREPALVAGEDPQPIQNYRVVLGALPGLTVDTSGGGLTQDARTLALQVPAIGSGPGGIEDGDTFTISNGNIEQAFEFTLDAQIDDGEAIAINVNSPLGTLTGDEVALLINQAIVNSTLGLTPTVDGDFVYLDLPSQGFVTTSAGQVRSVGVSRPLIDGDIIRVARAPEAPSSAIEINTTFPAGQPVETSPLNVDSLNFTLQIREGEDLPREFTFEFDTSDETPAVVTPGNIAIDVTEEVVNEDGTITQVYVSRGELSRRIATAMNVRNIGLDPVPQDEFVFITVPDGQEVTIDTDFTGINLTDEAQFVQRQTLEFHLRTDADPTGLDVTPGHIPVVYELTDTAEELAVRVANQLNVIANATDNDGEPLVPGLLDGSARVASGQVAVSVNADNPVQLTVTEGSSLEVRGEPGVSGTSTVQVFGPLLLNIPTLGGVSVINGSVLVLTDVDGNEVVFQFSLTGAPFANIRAGATVIPYSTNDSAEILATALSAAINDSAAGLDAVVLNGTQVSLGRIDRSRVSNTGLPGFTGATAIGIQRGIVSDGEILRIRQGDISVSFEFDSVENGGGVQPGNVQVSFQPNSSPGDIAESLAAAIRNNTNGLRFTPGVDGTVYPIAEISESGLLTGGVILNDLPGTQVDTSRAPTLNVTGVPGGAIPITISPLFSAETVKQVILQALNNVNRVGELPTTTLVAEDRGGDSLYIENALVIEGPISNFLLPAIKDKVGNDLKPNRDDRTTQFTINPSDIELDFGDAPDPVGLVAGRYPTRLSDNGARHVIGKGPTLGRSVDSELDALSVRTADGDDFTIAITGGGGLFANRLEDGVVKVDVNPTNAFDVTQFDGETFTVDTGPQVATFEFDTDGIFNEDNYVIWAPGYQGERVLTSADSALLSEANIAQGIENAILQSPINPASVRSVTDPSTGLVSVEISGDDEDGVIFSSPSNPLGVFNPSPGSVTPIEVTVNGEGVLEAWIDFNADGDWNDPGELIISPNLAFPEGTPNPAIFGPGETVRSYDIRIPSTTRTTTGDTYARFRISRNGVGSPVGLALSGEVEDYRVRIVNGTPPSIANTSVSYTIQEGGFLQASDDVGVDAFDNNNGLLVGVTTTPARPVAIFADDIGSTDLFGANGELAGTITIARNGTFTFDATDDFSGEARFRADGTPFSVLVTDVRPNEPGDQLVSNDRISVTINVTPVNDRPTLAPNIVASDVLVTRTINEDNVISQQDQTIPGPVVFNASELITPFYVAGPGTEPSEQELVFFSAGLPGTPFRTSQGGTLSIGSGGLTINYTPPENYNGTDPDVFNYTVSDRLLSSLPGTIVSETALVSGRVEIVINAINDNPIVIGESYQTQEDQAITIPVFGPRTINGQIVNGILDNDEPGPPDEKAAPANQTISLKPNQFTSIRGGQIVQELRTPGGTIRQVGNDLIYTPLLNFSGTDRFNYIVVDSEGAESTATATIAVGDVNKKPVFSGISGEMDSSQPPRPRTIIELDERKQAGESETYDLNSWFEDPDGDLLQFTIASVSNRNLITPVITNSQLTLDLTPFQSGTASFTITATDPDGLISDPTIITVNVASSPDEPSVAGSFDPTRVVENSTFVGDLKREVGENEGLFLDVDGDNFTYRVRRLGNLTNPTPNEIASHPLISRIDFIGDSVRIVPQPFQSGSVPIEIEVFDGTFVNSHTFTFIIDATESAPIGNFTSDDAYSVPLGGVLRITDPNLGLLRNDFDPDEGSTIRVDVASLTQPASGTGVVSLLGRTDGAFSFTASNGANRPVAGQTDTFTYRVIDNTGRLSEPVTVSITFNQSNFQNPIDRYDVTADGFVTAVDALRVINLLNAENGSVNVSDLQTSPPDYYDVSGDGTITAVDVLQVINELNRRDVDGNNGSSEPIDVALNGALNGALVSAADFGVTTTAAADTFATAPTGSSVLRSLASTQAFASASRANLSTVNVDSPSVSTERTVATVTGDTNSSLDAVLAGGMDLQSGAMSRADQAAGSLASDLRSSQLDEPEAKQEAFDSALQDLFSDSSQSD